MFEVRLSDEAQWDFEYVVSHHANISVELAEYFISSYDETLLRLEIFPFFQIRYNNIKLRQIKNFPIILHFVIYNELQVIVIYGVRFGHENPENYPKI